MLLTYGATNTIDKNLPWYMVELRSERTMEGTIKRMGLHIHEYFKDSPVELFIPISKRDIDTFELSTGNYIFARSPNFEALLKMKKITGIIGLMTYGESNRPAHVIPIENTYVSQLIEDVRKKFEDRVLGVQEGTFVRIIDGDMRDMCGTVLAVHNGTACVQVQLKTKELFVETPVRNLLNLNHIPASQRVFYYSPLVKDLADDGGSYMFQEDVSFVEETDHEEDGLSVNRTKPNGRQQTITAHIKRLIFTGTVNPLEISKDIVAALKADTIKRPKTLSILHGVIKGQLVSDYFIPMNPGIRNYRDVVKEYGDSWRFSIKQIAEIDPELGIPSKMDEEKNK